MVPGLEEQISSDRLLLGITEEPSKEWRPQGTGGGVGREEQWGQQGGGCGGQVGGCVDVVKGREAKPGP